MAITQSWITVRLIWWHTVQVVAPKIDVHDQSQLYAHLLHCFLPGCQLEIAASSPGEASLKDVGVGMGV